ncbi:hypothetical protein [Gulosibacter chungangensis]|uniref:hypothetical protein n=1 Tax=Gulosibacter chungangensis TaxID=979746 RepID=UPI00298E15E8|nr:hypothetical protein [Gulosibacter chungangensis]
MTLSEAIRDALWAERDGDLAHANGVADSKVYLSPPDIGLLEETAVVRALRSGWVAPAGPELAAFEAELAARVGVG